MLVDLAADQNYTAMDTSCPAPVSAQGRETSACFSATTSSADAITWQSQLNYSTSGGHGAIADPNGAFLIFTTNSGDYYQNHQYSFEGGQVNVVASSVASDGSTVDDCTTFYVEGPAVVNRQGGIPNSDLTNQLAGTGSSYPNSYPNSTSFPAGGIQDLMARVAVYESLGVYLQFLEPTQPPKNVDLWDLYKNTNGEIAAKWPIESQLPGGISDGGSHIGLIQVMTDPNQITSPAGLTPDPNAWN